MLTCLCLVERQRQWGQHGAKEIKLSLRSGLGRLQLGETLTLRQCNAVHMSSGARLALEHDSSKLGNFSPTFLIYDVEIKFLPHSIIKIK